MLTFAIKSRLFRRDSILLRFRDVGRDFCMIKIVFFPQHTKLGQSVQKLRPAAHKADDSYQVLGLCRSSGAFEERNNSVQLLQELGSQFLAADLKGQQRAPLPRFWGPWGPRRRGPFAALDFSFCWGQLGFTVYPGT